MVIRHISLREQISDLLLEKLCGGLLQSGQKLNIAALARELSVSATPMREALFGLADKGMIDFTNNKGFCLKVLNYEDAQELYQLASILEKEALASSDKIDDKTVNQLGKLMNKIKQQAKNNRVTFKTMSSFENLLVSHCSNKRLLNMIAELRYTLFQYEQLILKSGIPLDHAFDDHQQIIDLISQQKLAKAAELLGNTWLNCLPLLKELLDSGADICAD